MSEELNEYEEFQKGLHQKICDYQEAIQKGAKITINEVINDLRNEIQRYEDAHPACNQ